MLVKTENDGYMKDTSTGAFINTDNDSYAKFVAERAKSKKSQDLSNRINAVEDDLREIKNLLLQIVHRNN
jgi:hypothetical protein